MNLNFSFRFYDKVLIVEFNYELGKVGFITNGRKRTLQDV